MRIGVFGGTFDPVHLGHLILAEQCREQGKLDEVWFIPAARPPHKQSHRMTPFHQRVEMLALAIAGNTAFRVDELEKERPGPSYTADTLDELHRRRPDVEWFLIMGSDTLAEFPTWHESARIVARAGMVVGVRPGSTAISETALLADLHLPAAASLRIQSASVPQIDVSSSDLRRRVAEGRSLRYLVPRAVECYIQEKQLYQDEPLL